jgi:folate-dependent phosphoribosylglycinamide formyltransferase PurN
MKYAVITTNSVFSHLILSRFLYEYRAQIGVVIEAREIIKGKSALSILWHVLKQSGIRGFCYKAGTAAYGRVLDRIADTVPGVRWAFGPLTHAHHLGIPVRRFTDANSERCLEVLRGVRPDIVFAVNVYQRLTAPLLNLPRVGIINVHFGMLPRYRGMSPYMWAMAHGECEIGITALFMDEQLDTGDIVCQDSVPILPQDSVYELYVRGCLTARHLLVRIAAAAEDGAISRKPQTRAGGSYFSMVGPECIAEIRRRGHPLVRGRDLIQAAHLVGLFRRKVCTEAAGRPASRWSLRVPAAFRRSSRTMRITHRSARCRGLESDERKVSKA